MSRTDTATTKITDTLDSFYCYNIAAALWTDAVINRLETDPAPSRQGSARWRVPDSCPSRHCAWPVRCAGLLTISSSSSGHEEHMRIAGRPTTGRPLFLAAPC